MKAIDLKRLRHQAVCHSLFPATTMAAAIKRLSFVQADPIRAPATAQDLILRHRVCSYTTGDLDRRFSSMKMEEDVLYAYGFMTNGLARLLHQRNEKDLSQLESRVLAHVNQQGHTHPRDLDSHFGRQRVINDWGGYSQATKRALESLHHRGLVRVARRENGIRVYEATGAVTHKLSPVARYDEVILAMANIFSPAPIQSFQASLSRIRRRLIGPTGPRNQVDRLLTDGQMESCEISGISYIMVPGIDRQVEAPRCVRFLAPFDPLVWDRQRFEQFWGWEYRFEAYTPKQKRVRGYYAMPLLFGDSIIGWAEVDKADTGIDVKLGFVGSRPRSSEFKRGLDREIADIERFLKRNSSAKSGDGADGDR